MFPLLLEMSFEWSLQSKDLYHSFFNIINIITEHNYCFLRVSIHPFIKTLTENVPQIYWRSWWIDKITVNLPIKETNNLEEEFICATFYTYMIFESYSMLVAVMTTIIKELRSELLWSEKAKN